MNNKIKVYLYDDFGLFTPYYSSIYNTSISINNTIIISRFDNLPEYLELSVGDILDITCIYAPSPDGPSGGTNHPLPRATGLTTISMDYTNAFSVSYRLDDDTLSEYSITIYNDK